MSVSNVDYRSLVRRVTGPIGHGSESWTEWSLVPNPNPNPNSNSNRSRNHNAIVTLRTSELFPKCQKETVLGDAIATWVSRGGTLHRSGQNVNIWRQ